MAMHQAYTAEQRYQIQRRMSYRAGESLLRAQHAQDNHRPRSAYWKYRHAVEGYCELARIVRLPFPRIDMILGK